MSVVKVSITYVCLLLCLSVVIGVECQSETSSPHLVIDGGSIRVDTITIPAQRCFIDPSSVSVAVDIMYELMGDFEIILSSDNSLSSLLFEWGMSDGLHASFSDSGDSGTLQPITPLSVFDNFDLAKDSEWTLRVHNAMDAFQINYLTEWTISYCCKPIPCYRYDEYCQIGTNQCCSGLYCDHDDWSANECEHCLGAGEKCDPSAEEDECCGTSRCCLQPEEYSNTGGILKLFDLSPNYWCAWVACDDAKIVEGAKMVEDGAEVIVHSPWNYSKINVILIAVVTLLCVVSFCVCGYYYFIARFKQNEWQKVNIEEI